jgi:hypothetical protein
MPKLSNHKKDEVYKNIMGNGVETEQGAGEQISSQENPSTEKSINDKSISSPKKIDNDLDELIHKSYYITKRHVKALKFRTAVSDKPEEKDFSAIVRAALDLYLADDLKNI